MCGHGTVHDHENTYLSFCHLSFMLIFILTHNVKIGYIYLLLFYSFIGIFTSNLCIFMSGERNKSQEPKTSQAKRPRRGQTETREPTTDAKTIDTSIPCFSVSPETLLQHQESVSFPNMGVKRGNNATASASNNLPASPPVSDCHITIQPGDAGISTLV